MTYLEICNEVLMRLRESTVLTVQTNAYSKMIGLFVNDAKRQVEDAWTWDALYNTSQVTTVGGTSLYVVTGSGIRQKDVTVNNTTTGRQAPIRFVSSKWIQNQRQLVNETPGSPIYCAWSGNNGTDSKLEFYPVPDGVYTVSVNMCVPQAKLVSDDDVLLIPTDAVIAGAYARAIAERGEDGGMSSSEAYGLYKGILSDEIAVESSRDVDNDTWDAN